MLESSNINDYPRDRHAQHVHDKSLRPRNVAHFWWILRRRAVNDLFVSVLPANCCWTGGGEGVSVGGGGSSATCRQVAVEEQQYHHPTIEAV